MNATNLYTSTCRLILRADKADKSTWADLFRLFPYLRQSLCCTVCGNLLKEPYTPTSSGCQHQVCKNCKGGRKKRKPSCNWCSDYDNYTENLQLRALLQCYKILCVYFIGTDVYKTLLEEAAGVDSDTVATSGLIGLIQEGAGFSDNYKSTAYKNSSQTQVASTATNSETKSSQALPNSSKATSNGSPINSVMYAGSGNKITTKEKALDEIDSSQSGPLPNSGSKKSKKLGFKKPLNRTCSTRRYTKRKGCRCGNATPTPGKLTCCGQRCPCYVASKTCTECKCKGCKNPHKSDGMEANIIGQANMTHLESLQLPISPPPSSWFNDSLYIDNLTAEDSFGCLFDADININNVIQDVPQIPDVPQFLPGEIIMGEDVILSNALSLKAEDRKADW